jgi:hypothetical protein
MTMRALPSLHCNSHTIFGWVTDLRQKFWHVPEGTEVLHRNNLTLQCYFNSIFVKLNIVHLPCSWQTKQVHNQ